MPTAPYRPEEDSDIVQVSPPVKEVKLEAGSFGNSSPEQDDRDLYPPDQWPSARAEGHVKSTEEIKRELEERIQRAVDVTVKRVKQESDRIQSSAAPYVTRLQAFAEARPVLTTFLVIFLVLSAIPLTCFTFFVGGSILFILGIAAIGICVTTLGTLLFASSILLPVLLFTALVSFGILSALVSLFLLHRLYLHVSAACRVDSKQLDEAATNGDEADGHSEISYERVVQGVMTWAEETVERVGIPAENIGLSSTRPSGQRPINGVLNETHKDFGDDGKTGEAHTTKGAPELLGINGRAAVKESGGEYLRKPAYPTARGGD